MSTQAIKLCLGALACAWLLITPAGAAGWLLAQNTDSQPAISAEDQSPAAELSLWNDIKDSQNAQDYVDYLKRFPNGMFADPAKDRYEALSGQKFDPALIGGNTGPAAEPAAPKTETAAETKDPAVKRPLARAQKTVKVQKSAKVQKATKIKTATTKSTRKKTKIASSTKNTKKVAKPHKLVASKKLPTKRKQQVASKRKACNPDPLTGECVYATAAPERYREMFGNRGGGNRGGDGGGSSGSGGGGTGGWH